ncbi:MAG TPA: DUF480 domain-containing protein [Gemmatales bacterium]|nr:DUF480 domain-containing protein [Gemmatales bacterium]
MSTESPMPVSTQTSEPTPLPTLTPLERRILGVLVEKAKTTPDSYPLTLNSLITGCNQKSNREPVMDVSDAEVEEAIPNLKKLGYMQQIMGSGRTDKFRHCLYDAMKLDKVQLAIIAELLLRGAQSEGDLRGRANRMEPIADLEALRPIVKTLAERGMVIYLTPEGRRGTMVTHGFHTAEELMLLKSRAERWAVEEPVAAAAPRSAPASSSLEPRLVAIEQAVTELREQVADLKRQLGS